MFRIGIVGGGYITQHALVKAITATEGLSLAAVLDPDPNAIATVSRMSPESLVTSSETDFFDTPLDAIHVATPNNLHADFACRALTSGYATLVEKPLADTILAGRRIVEASRRSRCAAMMGYMSGHKGVNRYAKELIDSSAIGAIRAMTACFNLGPRSQNWRNRRSAAGLGALADLAIYPLITATQIFGTEATSCHAIVWPCDDPAQTDLYVQGTIWFGDDRHLVLNCSFTYLGVNPSGICEYAIVGSDGMLRVTSPWTMTPDGTVEIWNKASHKVIEVPSVNQYAVQYLILERCAKGIPVPSAVSLDRGLTDLIILHALNHSSAKGGVRIDISS